MLIAIAAAASVFDAAVAAATVAECAKVKPLLEPETVSELLAVTEPLFVPLPLSQQERQEDKAELQVSPSLYALLRLLQQSLRALPQEMEILRGKAPLM